MDSPRLSICLKLTALIKCCILYTILQQLLRPSPNTRKRDILKLKDQTIAEGTLQINGVEFAHADLHRVIDDFYTRIQHDSVLKIPFASVGDWPEHIEKLTHFWWVRFGGKPYLFNHYNPVAKHFFAGFNRELLLRWLSIFQDTLKDQLKPEQAQVWTMISERMGEVLSAKNEHFRSQYESRNDQELGKSRTTS